MELGRVERFVNKFHLNRFFNSKLILAIDLFVAFSASVCTLVFVRNILSDNGLTTTFNLTWMGLSIIFAFAYFKIFKTYRTIIRHTTLKEFAKICVASFLKSLSVLLIVWILPFDKAHYGIIVSMDMCLTIVLLLMVRVAMIISYDILREKVISSRKRINIMVYGVDDKSVATVTRLSTLQCYRISQLWPSSSWAEYPGHKDFLF